MISRPAKDAGYDPIMTDEADLAGLESRSIDEVRSMRASCQALEAQVSYVRRLAQGRLDIVDAELARRHQGRPPSDIAAMVADLPSTLGRRPDRPRLGQATDDDRARRARPGARCTPRPGARRAGARRSASGLMPSSPRSASRWPASKPTSRRSARPCSTGSMRCQPRSLGVTARAKPRSSRCSSSHRVPCERPRRLRDPLARAR